MYATSYTLYTVPVATPRVNPTIKCHVAPVTRAMQQGNAKEPAEWLQTRREPDRDAA